MEYATEEVIKNLCLVKTKESKNQKDLLYNLLTIQDIRDVTRSVWGNDAILIEQSIRSYSEGKLGFLGSHLQLHVEVKINNQKKNKSFFVKTVPYDVDTHAQYVLEKGVFPHEITFYGEIMPLLNEACPNTETWVPICYKTKKDLMIFEDLTNMGYSMKNKLFDKELVIAALSTIARMHAASLLTEDRLGAPLNQLYPHAFQEKAFVRSGKTYEWFNTGVNALIAVAEHLNLDSSLLSIVCEEIFEAVKPSSTKRNVVSHGDLWENNLMFNDEVLPKCLLIDFQLFRYSPLAHDVINLLYLCTSHTFRKLWKEDMVKHYYTILCETLKANGYRQKLPLWSELLEGLEEQRLGAVITAALYFQTVLMDEVTSAKIMEDPESYFEFEFRNRDKAIIHNMKCNLKYGNRITEITVELVDLASRLYELPRPS